MRFGRIVVAVTTVLWCAPAAGSNVVSDPSRRWPVRTIEVIVCDRPTALRLGNSVCAAQKVIHGSKKRSPRLSERDALRVRNTLARWNEELGRNIRFREVQEPTAKNTIVFRRSSRPTRCSTQGVGYSPTQRLKYISLGGRCGSGVASTSQGTIAHEMMHAIGIYHEQQRQDRARMIAVGDTGTKAHQWQSAPRNCEADCGSQPETRAIGKYDFGSVMHYSLKEGRSEPTRAGERRLRSQRLSTREVGQRRWLSAADQRSIRKLYPRRVRAGARSQ